MRSHLNGLRERANPDVATPLDRAGDGLIDAPPVARGIDAVREGVVGNPVRALAEDRLAVDFDRELRTDAVGWNYDPATGQIVCGHNPYLVASLAENPQIRTNEYDQEELEWQEIAK